MTRGLSCSSEKANVFDIQISPRIIKPVVVPVAPRPANLCLRRVPRAADPVLVAFSRGVWRVDVPAVPLHDGWGVEALPPNRDTALL
jgi:hypothetical protein